MRPSERIDLVDEARTDLHNAGRKERSPEEHAAQEPEPASWDDVELEAIGWPAQAANIRARIDANRSAWRQGVIELWTVRAEQIEERWRGHCASPEHQRWIAADGPARLWSVLNESKARAERDAALVREAKGDPDAFVAVAELQAWRMAEMVRLFLEEAAQ